MVNYTIDLSLEQEEDAKNDENDQKKGKSGGKIFDDSQFYVGADDGFNDSVDNQVDNLIDELNDLVLKSKKTTESRYGATEEESSSTQQDDLVCPSAEKA